MTPPPPPPRPKPGPLPPRPRRPPALGGAQEIFEAALEHDPGARDAYLATACGENSTLLAEVRALLTAHEAAGDFMRDDAQLSPDLERELARLKPEEGGETIGPYKLREQIGEGGFGTVWVADQEKPVRRRVALKIIKI